MTTAKDGKKRVRNPKTYGGIHTVILQTYGTAPCCIWDASHKGYRFEWANVSGTYTIYLEDYLPMCQSCHRRFDMTPETREKFRIAKTGNYRGPRTPVAQYFNNELVAKHISIAEAGRTTGVDRTSISEQLAGRNKTAGGFTWQRI